MNIGISDSFLQAMDVFGTHLYQRGYNEAVASREQKI